MSSSAMYLSALTLIAPCISMLDVANFTITLEENDQSGSDTTSLLLTLWWNYTIYEYTINQPEQNSSYTATPSTFTTVGTSPCNTADSKMIIENDHDNGVYISKIRVNTIDGTWYGVNSYCHTHGYQGTKPRWNLKDGACLNGETHLTVICVDNELTDCAPYRQVIHFDLSKPNRWHSTALVEDATDITAQVVSCDPTSSPSPSPSEHTTEPTTTPSAVFTNQQSDSDTLIMATTGTAIVVSLLCVILFAVYTYKCRHRRVHQVVNKDEAPGVERMMSDQVNILMTPRSTAGNNNVRPVKPVGPVRNYREDDMLTAEGDTSRSASVAIPNDPKGHRVREIDDDREDSGVNTQVMNDNPDDDQLEGDPQKTSGHGTTAGTDPGQT